MANSKEHLTPQGRYACKVCPKHYKHFKHLTRHGVFHTGERPFECDNCSETFRRRDSMQRHREKCVGKKKGGAGSHPRSMKSDSLPTFRLKERNARLILGRADRAYRGNFGGSKPALPLRRSARVAKATGLTGAQLPSTGELTASSSECGNRPSDLDHEQAASVGGALGIHNESVMEIVTAYPLTPSPEDTDHRVEFSKPQDTHTKQHLEKVMGRFSSFREDQVLGEYGNQGITDLSETGVMLPFYAEMSPNLHQTPSVNFQAGEFDDSQLSSSSIASGFSSEDPWTAEAQAQAQARDRAQTPTAMVLDEKPGSPTVLSDSVRIPSVADVPDSSMDSMEPMEPIGGHAVGSLDSLLLRGECDWPMDTLDHFGQFA